MVSETISSLAHVRRRTLLCGLIALGMGSASRSALGNVPVGTAISVDGSVALEREGKTTPLAPDDPLMIDDNVFTREDGFALLMLLDRTRVNLGADSHLTIDQFIADQGGVMTIGGAILFDRAEDLAPIDMTVLTAFGQIGVRGTRFFAGPTKGVFSVFVDRGRVEVSAAGETRTLRAGEGVEIPSMGAPPGDVVTWGQARIAEAFASVRVER